MSTVRHIVSCEPPHARDSLRRRQAGAVSRSEVRQITLRFCGHRRQRLGAIRGRHCVRQGFAKALRLMRWFQACSAFNFGRYQYPADEPSNIENQRSALTLRSFHPLPPFVPKLQPKMYVMSRNRTDAPRRVPRHRNDEQLRALLAAATSVVWTTDAGGAFVTRQPAWEAYTGQPWEEHRGWG